MVYYKTINSKSYSLEERENLLSSFYFDEKEPHILLQTCNRIEIYWGEGEISDSLVRHVYRVASGLESNLIGERSIQGQLKNAYLDACKKYQLSSELHKLFQMAMHTGKRVRTKTKISVGAMSHSQATVDLIKAENENLNECAIGLIGVNKLTIDILKFLQSQNVSNIYIANRSCEKADNLAKEYGCQCIPFCELNKMVEFSDILICATSAPNAIINADHICSDKPLTIFDLAFPRDVDQSVDELEHVKVYNLDMIEKKVQVNVQIRENEVDAAEQIIEEEIKKFFVWQSNMNKKYNNYIYGT